MAQAWPQPGSSRFTLALVLATAVHAGWIFGLRFDLELQPPPRINRSLDVMVVRHPRSFEPEPAPDYLAQTNERGGGDTEEKHRPKSPTFAPVEPPAPPEPEPVPAAAPSPPPPAEPEPPAPRVIRAHTNAPQTRPKPAPTPAPVAERHPLPTISELLASRRREANRITAELARDVERSAKNTRRKHVTASTQEYKYAAYLDAWRRKVERIGNLNYPPEAKRRKLYGNLMLTVALRADGSVERIRLLRSSGHQLLDDSAIRIVRLAAPYAPFPAEIREETDILEITRTWQFLSNNRLFSGD